MEGINFAPTACPAGVDDVCLQFTAILGRRDKLPVIGCSNRTRDKEGIHVML